MFLLNLWRSPPQIEIAWINPYDPDEAAAYHVSLALGAWTTRLSAFISPGKRTGGPSGRRWSCQTVPCWSWRVGRGWR